MQRRGGNTDKMITITTNYPDYWARIYLKRIRNRWINATDYRLGAYGLTEKANVDLNFETEELAKNEALKRLLWILKSVTRNIKSQKGYEELKTQIQELYGQPKLPGFD